MDDVGEEHNHKRRRREAVLPLEPAQRLDQRPRARQRNPEKEDEAEDPGLAQELEREVVRLGRDGPVHAQLAVREVERTRPRAEHGVRAPRPPRLLPPVPAAARREVREVVCPLPRGYRGWLVELVQHPRRGDPGGQQRSDADQRSDDNCKDNRAAESQPPGLGQRPAVLVAGREERCRERSDPAENEREPEPAAVVHLQRVRLAVLRQPGARESPTAHSERRHERNR